MREVAALRQRIPDELMKFVDMVTDWSQGSSRVLSAIPMEDIPENLKKALVKMVESAKECAMALRKCINRIPDKSEEALQAADEVERLEEKVDDLFENSRRLIAREEKIRVGTVILLNISLKLLKWLPIDVKTPVTK